MSELSTVAIKDGHRGHPHSHHTYDRAAPVTNQDSERADRISRLPGLERVTTLRQNSNASLPPGASATNPQGYFEAPIPPQTKGRSTVGSASATGSVGGRTTWASGSEPTDTTDKMSMSEDMDTEGAEQGSDDESLVGFGEGASSTMSGPTSGMMRTPHRQSARLSALSAQSQDTPRDPRNMDGMTYERSRDGMVDTAPFAASANRADTDVNMTEAVEHSDGRKELGNFAFER